MNANAKKLVEALRSGKYKQIQGQLHDGYGYCCLGVACEIYGQEHGIEFRASDDSRDPSWKFDVDGIQLTGNLSRSVSEYFGFTTGYAEFGKSDGIKRAPTLIKFNDAGVSFQLIADLIESEPKGLFVSDKTEGE